MSLLTTTLTFSQESEVVHPCNQGRNKEYFFITDLIFLPKMSIPDRKNDDTFDPGTRFCC